MITKILKNYKMQNTLKTWFGRWVSGKWSVGQWVDGFGGFNKTLQKFSQTFKLSKVAGLQSATLLKMNYFTGILNALSDCMCR